MIIKKADGTILYVPQMAETILQATNTAIFVNWDDIKPTLEECPHVIENETVEY